MPITQPFPLGLLAPLPRVSPQDLEAQLLQSEREKDNVRSQLHELQLSLRITGEFGNMGNKLR